MPAWPGTVEIDGVETGRLGLSLAGLRTTGMWGEPRDRAAALRTIRRAVDLGVGLIEVPVPFGPWADLLRQAGPSPERVALALRLTGADPGADLEVAQRRLGPALAARVAVILALPTRLAALRASLGGRTPVVGVWAADGVPGWRPGQVGALRAGPGPVPAGILERLGAEKLLYLAPDPQVLGAADLTVALLEPNGPAHLERLYGQAVTPPDAGPG